MTPRDGHPASIVADGRTRVESLAPPAMALMQGILAGLAMKHGTVPKVVDVATDVEEQLGEARERLECQGYSPDRISRILSLLGLDALLLVHGLDPDSTGDEWPADAGDPWPWWIRRVPHVEVASTGAPPGPGEQIEGAGLAPVPEDREDAPTPVVEVHAYRMPEPGTPIDLAAYRFTGSTPDVVTALSIALGLAMRRDLHPVLSDGPGVCRVCRCVESAPCLVFPRGGEPRGCSWVEPDLCSVCAPVEAVVAPFHAHQAARVLVLARSNPAPLESAVALFHIMEQVDQVVEAEASGEIPPAYLHNLAAWCQLLAESPPATKAPESGA